MALLEKENSLIWNSQLCQMEGVLLFSTLTGTAQDVDDDNDD